MLEPSGLRASEQTNRFGRVVGKCWKMRLSAENLTATAEQIIVPEPGMGMLTHGGLPCMQVSPGRLFLTERRLIWYKWGN